MFEPIKIELKNPLQYGEEEIKEIVFEREMEAGDLRGISVSRIEHDDICTVASRLTNIPTPILKKMKMSDYVNMAEVVGSFFGDSPLTGGRD